MKIVLGITGASGVIYGIRLAEELKKSNVELTIIVSDAGNKVIATEAPDGLARLAKSGHVFSEHDLEAAVSSGSVKFDSVSRMPMFYEDSLSHCERVRLQLDL